MHTYLTMYYIFDLDHIYIKMISIQNNTSIFLLFFDVAQIGYNDKIWLHQHLGYMCVGGNQQLLLDRIEVALREDMIQQQEDTLAVMICMTKENMVIDIEHEDMIQMDRETVIHKQDVLVDVAEKQEQFMIKEVSVEGIEANREGV